MIKKALVWDPYLDTLGGGERYSLTVAQCLGQMGAKVTVPWDDSTILSKAHKRFGLDLVQVETDAKLFEFLTSRHGLWQRYRQLRQFDVIFWVSDGSVPMLFGKKNLIHYQVPFRKINGSLMSNQLKLLTTDRIVVNSKFTQQVIRRTLPTLKTVVLYPPVDVEAFVPGNKIKTILSVGRFVSPSHPKRQDILIDAFRRMHSENPEVAKDWKLVLAGGHQGDEAELNLLRRQAESLSIEFVTNPDHSQLKKLYASASIYWHAAGFGVDEKQEPEKVEHFGITTVEAMAAGAVPVVINKGGQKEIVSDATGYLFDDEEELIKRTLKLIGDKDLLKQLSESSHIRAKDFSQLNFYAGLRHILS